ncbi:hypothetical protein [Curtobacterium sp. MCBD17_008]|uniref:hypothetical protein n=1 Tax=Curtobacterium sp. MCBD17_008 TaxID=2175656 RepID=UPI000DA71365|nr:hypothetical protein [Curtobacterium sp. MCBD17_008]PZE95278.1 hypothetical protein DEI95_02620 [Curtobacterium sp. MCBD17_008]
MPWRPDRVPGPGRARDDQHRWSSAGRLLVLRWVIVGVWVALLTARIIVVTVHPDADMRAFGIAEAVAVTAGVTIVVLAVVRARAAGRRRADDVLARAVRRIDPTVWLVPAAPTQELRGVIEAARPEVPLTARVTWAFGATEASLWELDGRRATRLLVIRWSRVMHVGTEVVLVPGAGRRTAPAVAVHYVRADDTTAVATFFVRVAPGSDRLLGPGARLDDLLARLARERIVA